MLAGAALALAEVLDHGETGLVVGGNEIRVLLGRGLIIPRGDDGGGEEAEEGCEDHEASERAGGDIRSLSSAQGVPRVGQRQRAWLV